MTQPRAGVSTTLGIKLLRHGLTEETQDGTKFSESYTSKTYMIPLADDISQTRAPHLVSSVIS